MEVVGTVPPHPAMDHLDVVLPAILVLMAFILKIVVDRTATLPDLISATLELPVDMAVLATSFIISFTIASPKNSASGLLHFTVYIFSSILVVVLWRRSTKAFTADKLWLSLLLGALNYLLCLTGLWRSVALLSR